MNTATTRGKKISGGDGWGWGVASILFNKMLIDVKIFLSCTNSKLENQHFYCKSLQKMAAAQKSCIAL